MFSFYFHPKLVFAGGLAKGEKGFSSEPEPNLDPTQN